MHFEWDENVLKMWEHSKEVCARGARARREGNSRAPPTPDIPGWSLHETGTCRMGNDPKKFVTNRFGQTHDVPNLYVCDASVFSELHRQDHHHQHSRLFAAHLRTSDRELPARRTQSCVSAGGEGAVGGTLRDEFKIPLSRKIMKLRQLVVALVLLSLVLLPVPPTGNTS